MWTIPKVNDIDDEDNIFIRKFNLTKNEYYASKRNKVESDDLKLFYRHVSDQNDTHVCKLRTNIHDLRTYLRNNRSVVCNINEFYTSRKVKISL